MTRASPVTPGMIFDQLLDGQGGWDGVRGEGHPPPQSRSDYAAAAEAARRVFSSDDGRFLLQWLIDNVLLTATWPGDVMGAEKALTHGCWREGQNSIVMMLHAMIAEDFETEETRDD